MSRRFEIRATRLDGLLVLERNPIRDARGYLERLYCSEELRDLVGERRIVQINRTLTVSRGTVRGMHFQRPPSAEMKLVSCLRGEVFDVAVDLRRGSGTRLQWHGEVLSADNRRSMLIPEGFAHGFQTLVDDCELLYFHTHAYIPQAEDGLNPLDPALTIHWPLAVSAISTRDQAFPPVTSDFHGIEV